MIQTNIIKNTDETATGCPECGEQLARHRIETYCSQCGLVVGEDPIDRGPDWRRSDGPGRSRRHVGAPLTAARHDRGLSTTIGYGNGQSRRLTGRTRRRFARLRRHHSRAQVRDKLERNRIYGFSEIHRLTAYLDLPEWCKERSCRLFTAAQREDLLRGRSIEGFAAASVYATCRLASLSRTRSEVADAARGTEGELVTAYDAINRELGLATGPIDPSEYLPRFASELDVPDDVELRARSFVDKLTADGYATGRNPSGVAAACLYTAAREYCYNLTQDDAADIADVATVTIRGTYQYLVESDES